MTYDPNRDYELSLRKMELRRRTEKVAAIVEDMNHAQDRRDLKEARERIAALEARLPEADAPPPGTPKVTYYRKPPPRMTGA